jgi:hypothetical protein
MTFGHNSSVPNSSVPSSSVPSSFVSCASPGPNPPMPVPSPFPILSVPVPSLFLVCAQSMPVPSEVLNSFWAFQTLAVLESIGYLNLGYGFQDFDRRTHILSELSSSHERLDLFISRSFQDVFQILLIHY